ncbi:putative glycerophosphoryl diester phosphodiesterase 2 [Carex littledalei]|uniref:glycerophosphodiester phosphodiesterase n=1 Tax=Carex littledalei TaxID=544730 RepID=A0A833VAL4_9POAL|nr:putative glycerophosphoryl diester phosphodiesterase 2 [Carex littledalei]
MGKRRNSLALCELATLFLVQILVLAAGQSTNASSWKTLNGKPPVVIARGGFSGTFPDSSSAAYSFALIASSSDTILWCDIQLTKDGVPICLPSITLDNCTSIGDIYPKGKKQYDVNGVITAGWFAVDYNSSELSQVSLRQPIWSRTEKFDGTQAILSVTDLTTQVKPSSLWLNMQYPTFYEQRGHNLRNYTISLIKQVIINYISSPEEEFLKGIGTRISPKTKLIFRFPSEYLTDPSTNKTYDSLKDNLTYIKTFASGILVPKGYIWPVSSDNYLMDHTSLVTDAHKAGLEVYAADFANDNLFSYNYSYDPLAEYLQFIDKGDFSVDGVLSDYPITPAEAIGTENWSLFLFYCTGNPLIISHNGASGDYPDCTDLGYQKAVDDGADVIDCTVQVVTKDGVLICMSSVDLIHSTNAAQSQFSSLSSTIPVLQTSAGIFTFNLTWNEISQSLKPMISSPESQFYISRNPRNMNAGKFLKLSDFLAFSKGKDIGVLLILEDVAFIQERLGFDMISLVTTTLTEAGYGNQTSLQVNVLSPDSAVLAKLRQDSKYKLIYKISTKIRDASTASVADIKRFADAVAIDKYSVYPVDLNYITNMTNVLHRFQSAGLKVYGYGFMNEFVSQAWDFFADATVELNTYYQGAGIDGFITDFPATARRYKRSQCFNAGNNTPAYFEPVQVGGLIELIVAPAQPPALAPLPVLNASDVLEAPLPPASVETPKNASGPSTQPSQPSQPSHTSRTVTSISLLVFLLPAIVLLV